ncbi:MAG: M56 family metallopeptidase [Phycisphaerae bacterium]|nr:M56 family metallopeptidase [Phycisphaerae bacterium]
MSNTALEFAYWVNQTADVWWQSMGHASVQAGVAAAIGLGLVTVCKRWSSPLRYGILVVLLVKFMLAPFLVIPNEANDLLIVEVPVRSEITLRDIAMPQGTSQESTAVSAADTVVVKTPVLPAPASSLEDPAVWSLIGFKGWCFLGHLLGTLGVVCWLVMQCVWLGLWVVRESSDASPDIQIMSQEVRADLAYSKRPDVRVSAKAHSPMAFQLRRPVIVLPRQTVETLTLEELRPVLAHEMAHLKRRDPLVNTLQILLFGIWWFHPVYWWLNRALRSVREECCDDVVLTRAAQPEDRYCQVLLDAARACQVATAGRVVLGFGESGSSMKQRIVRIMDTRVHKRARLGVLAGAGLVLAILVSIPLWQRSSSMNRPRPVTDASFSPSILESLLRGRGPGLFLEDREFTELKDCIEVSRLTRHTINGISQFTLDSTRDTLQDLSRRAAHPFYADFLLAQWYGVNQDPNESSQWMTQALAHAPVVLVRRYELMDGRPLANTPVGRLGVEYRMSTPTQSNTYLTLEYINLTTDEKGQVYLPGLDTKIRCNGVESPKGYEIETGRHGYLSLHAQYNRLPTIYAWPKGVRKPTTTLPASKFYDYAHAKAVQGLSHRVGMAEFTIDRCYRMGGDGQVTVTDGRKRLNETSRETLALSDTHNQVLDQAIVHFNRSTFKSHEILQVRVFDHRSRGLLTEYHAPADYEYDGESSIVLRSLGQRLPERVDVWFWVTEFSPDQKAKVLAAKAGSTVTFPEYGAKLISLKSGSHVQGSDADTSHDASGDREIDVVLKTTAQAQRMSRFDSSGDSEQYARLALVTKAGKRHFSGYVLGRANTQNTYRFGVPMSELSHFELLPMGREKRFFFDGVRLPDRSGAPLDRTDSLAFDVKTHGEAGVFVSDTAAPIYVEVTAFQGQSTGSSHSGAQGMEDPRATGQWTLSGPFRHRDTYSTLACAVKGLSTPMLRLEILDLSGKPFETRSAGYSGHVRYQSQAVPVSQIQGVRVRLSWDELLQTSER